MRITGGCGLAALRKALLEHLVIFFRDQKLTPQQQLAFARAFGRFLSQAYARGRAALLPCTARRANNVRTMARLYTRTDAGRKAWDTQNGVVALDCRRVLGLVGRDTDPTDLRAKLGWSESAVDDILQELEEAGLVKSVEAAPSGGDLDFTGNFLVADIQAALQHGREDLDFTDSFNAAELRAAPEKK